MGSHRGVLHGIAGWHGYTHEIPQPAHQETASLVGRLHDSVFHGKYRAALLRCAV